MQGKGGPGEPNVQPLGACEARERAEEESNEPGWSNERDALRRIQEGFSSPKGSMHIPV